MPSMRESRSRSFLDELGLTLVLSLGALLHSSEYLLDYRTCEQGRRTRWSRLLQELLRVGESVSFLAKLNPLFLYFS